LGHEGAAHPAHERSAFASVASIRGRRKGFRGPFSWYRDIDRNWVARPVPRSKVTPPALFIAGGRDSVVAISRASGCFAAAIQRGGCR